MSPMEARRSVRVRGVGKSAVGSRESPQSRVGHSGWGEWPLQGQGI